jgi:hypothetical protein
MGAAQKAHGESLETIKAVAHDLDGILLRLQAEPSAGWRALARQLDKLSAELGEAACWLRDNAGRQGSE